MRNLVALLVSGSTARSGRLGASNASAEQDTHFVEELPSCPPL
ncbi:hypothetical protein ABZV80_15155 [Streptomyces sp. NPDC005132]